MYVWVKRRSVTSRILMHYHMWQAMRFWVQMRFWSKLRFLLQKVVVLSLCKTAEYIWHICDGYSDIAPYKGEGSENEHVELDFCGISTQFEWSHPFNPFPIAMYLFPSYWSCNAYLYHMPYPFLCKNHHSIHRKIPTMQQANDTN